MNGFDMLRVKLRELMNEHSDAATVGVVPDWGHYQHLRGVIEGLALAERELLDLKARLTRDDEDA